MDMWIQKVDYSSEETNNISKDTAKELLKSYDWEAENSLKSEDNDCDPGFGLIAEDGNLLHICPQDNSECYVNFEYKVGKKLLGILPLKVSKNHHIKSCSLVDAVKLIDYLFDGNIEEILKVGHFCQHP